MLMVVVCCENKEYKACGKLSSSMDNDAETYIYNSAASISVIKGVGQILGPEGRGFQSTDLARLLMLINVFLEPVSYNAATNQLVDILGENGKKLLVTLIDSSIITLCDGSKKSINLEIVQDLLSSLFEEIDIVQSSSSRMMRQSNLSKCEYALMAALQGFSDYNADFENERIELTQQFEYIIKKTKSPIRLNIGGGKSQALNWINVDTIWGDCVFDIVWPWPVDDGQISSIYMGHVLEHLDHGKASTVLNEVYRVLCDGGLLRVVVPDAFKWMNAYVKNDNDFFDAAAKVWPNWPWQMPKLEIVSKYLGAGNGNERLLGHKVAYDFESLASKLTSAGFVGIEQSDYMQSRYPDLNIDQTTSLGARSSDPGKFALYVDAVKVTQI